MQELWPPSGDAVEIFGLSVILDEEELPGYLELGLRCGDRKYRVVVLAADGEWALRVSDERGQAIYKEPELYPSQSSAILAAALTVIGASHTG